MYLCGSPLPWVDSLKHLGNMVSNKIDGAQLDMKVKRAKYIDKNCNLNQEFKFSHPTSRITLNNIYNCHFSGSPIWNLFSEGAAKFEGTYNKSVKIMAGLPLPTHRYLIEPVTGTSHMKIKLIRNFLKFIKSVKGSTKPVLKQLYNLAKDDVRTTTGANLRNILLLTNKLNVDDLEVDHVDMIKYHPVEEKDKWRIGMMKELIEIQQGNMTAPEVWV